MKSRHIEQLEKFVDSVDSLIYLHIHELATHKELMANAFATSSLFEEYCQFHCIGGSLYLAYRESLDDKIDFLSRL